MPDTPPPNYEALSANFHQLTTALTRSVDQLHAQVGEMNKALTAVQITLARVEERTSGIKEQGSSSENLTFRYVGIIFSIVAVLLALYGAFIKSK